MTRPTAFVGELAPYGIDNERRTAIVRVGIPWSELQAAVDSLGVAPRPGLEDDPEHMRGVALLKCRTPRYPQTEADVLAETCTLTLTALFDARALGTSMRPVLFGQLAALFNAIEAAWQLPLDGPMARPEEA